MTKEKEDFENLFKHPCPNCGGQLLQMVTYTCCEAVCGCGFSVKGPHPFASSAFLTEIGKHLARED